MQPGEPELLLVRAGRHAARSASAARQAPYASRSYREPWALLAWHGARVGVDIERIEPNEPSFGRSICTPQELRSFAADLDGDAFVASLWSSKEALSKALGNALDYDPRRLPSPLGWPQLGDGVYSAGGWTARVLQPPAVPDAHVGWLVWRTPR